MHNTQHRIIVDGVRLYPVPRNKTDFRYIPDDTKVFVTSDGKRVYLQTPKDPEPKNQERFFNRSGYECIAVGRDAQLAIHRLVCLAFYGLPPTDAHIVTRRNGIRTDNSPANLYWATKREANQAAFNRRNPPMRLDAAEERNRLLLEMNEAESWAAWYADEPNPMLAEQWELRAQEARKKLRAMTEATT